MLPLDVISPYKTMTDPTGLAHQLDRMANISVDGFMVDVWWGLTEPFPKVYNFTIYRELFNMAKKRGLKVQAVASFHRCGGNVGDRCNIPVPDFVSAVDGIWYTDASGEENREYISLFADDVPIKGRTPVDMYRDWLAAFAADFSDDLGSTIVEIMVGMGPAGELRYPSYPLSHWHFCGIGEFQAFDPHARDSLLAAAEKVGRPDWGAPPGTASTGNYNSRPADTEFFTTGYKTDYGKFFLNWYSGALLQHGQRVLAAANEVLQGRVGISGKVSGIHWWYDTDVHPAEATAGYYNTNFRNAYDDIAKVFAREDATMDFTCLEMRNTEQPKECRSNPQDLVKQVIAASRANGIPFAGENALQRYDNYAYTQMESYRPDMISITYLRLTPDLIESENLAKFGAFVVAMHGEQAEVTAADNSTVTTSLMR